MSDVEYPKSYEALGRFVEAFEGMVHEVRSISIRLLSDDKDQSRSDLVEIALHHQSLTAKPIFEIFRAVIVQIVNTSIEAQKTGRKTEGFSLADREIFLGVMKTIADEYLTLANMRNNLLHGAWFVGYGADSLGDEFDIHKYTVTKEGLSRVELPTKTTQLLELCDRCNALPPWLWKIEGCVTGMYKISETFERSGSDWVISAGHTTLPKNRLDF
jgi:hypothetical protein